MKVLNIGSSAYDNIIHVDEIKEIKDDMSLWANNTFTMIGSTGAGKALTLHSLGVDTTFVTCVGEDKYAPLILEELQQLNMTLQVFRRDKSVAHTNVMHSRGKRITIATSYPTIMPKIEDTQIKKLVDDADIVLLNINDFGKLFIPYLKKACKLVIVDLHDYNQVNPYHKDFIEIADILITSEINISDPVSYMENHINNGKKYTIVTRGGEGLIAMDQNKKLYTHAGFEMDNFVDSNGAGDAFVAGFSVRLFETNSFIKALQFGTVCGGLSCTSNKLFNTNFTREDINSIAKEKELL